MDLEANNRPGRLRPAKKCKTKTADFIVLSEGEKNKKPEKWSEIPLVLLEKIFAFLDHFDRVNMSLVCRAWSEGFSSPSVWKNFRFALTQSMISEASYFGLKFVRKYSKLFRHVDIEYLLTIAAPRELINIWCKHFMVFLEILANNSQLTSIKIQNLYVCFFRVDTSTCVGVKRAIAAFLGSQRCLEKVELHFLVNNYEEYNEILKYKYENSKDSIRCIRLHGLNVFDFEIREKDSTAQNSLLSVLKFPNLETLSTDYSRIFENTFSCKSVVMETLKNLQTRDKHLNLILHYNRCCDVNFLRGLTSTDWQFLKNLYPNLHVYLYFKTALSSVQEVEFLFVPEMPIVNLYLTVYPSNLRYNSTRKEIQELFSRLLERMGTAQLESLYINLSFPILDFNTTFVSFIQAFKKLKYLCIFITPYSTSLELLMESWLGNRPESLKEVYMKIYDVKHNYAMLEKLTKECVSRLKLQGLNIKIDIFRKK